MEQRDNWTTLLQRPARCRQPRILFETRSAEVLAHRLLHKIALHDIGTCDSCGEAEAIEHYVLINCWQNEIAAAVKNICDQRRTASHYRRSYVRQRVRRLTHQQLWESTTDQKKPNVAHS